VRAYLETECVDGDSGRVNAETGARVAAIMPVHLLGHPCDIDPLLEIASKYGIPVVEDATEALGARYKGRAVGSFGASACFSFNGNKLISCGGGGMLTTNEADTARYARYLSTTAKDNAEEYVHGEVGYNYRLTNIQAALGVSQLESLDAFIAAKLETANAYAEGLGEVPGVEVMPEAPWAESVFWLYTVRINPTAFGMSAPELRQRLKADNIDTRPLWQPLHVSPAYRHLKPRRNPVAEDIHARAVSLPSSVGLTPDQRARVIDRVREACALAV
jgi:perosamine synthetase